MRKTLLFGLVLSLSVSLLGCANAANDVQRKVEGQSKEALQQTEQSDQTEQSEKEEVTSIVESFGKKLQTVSLPAPEDVLKKSMQENYGGLVSQSLLEKWISDPLNAPGRLTSSPWPDRIEIQSIEKLSENAYEVKGQIIEITSVEKVSGGAAAKRPITLAVKKTDDRWLIDDITLGTYDGTNSIGYKNTQYGFNFSLPESWKEYKIVTDKWEGLAFGGQQDEKAVETGPVIYIRHPQWTSENPRQDIPIMIFTIAQWNSLQQGKFHIGAAPVGPTELGRNNMYVFALPARYNYAFLPGYEEVEDILNSNSLKPTEVK